MFNYLTKYIVKVYEFVGLGIGCQHTSTHMNYTCTLHVHFKDPCIVIYNNNTNIMYASCVEIICIRLVECMYLRDKIHVVAFYIAIKICIWRTCGESIRH